MYILPLVRTNRAIAASLLYPENPVQAIAISEIISVFVPLLNTRIYTKMLGITIAMMYNPTFAEFFIENLEKCEIIYYQGEICTSLLFILFLAVQYIK